MSADRNGSTESPGDIRKAMDRGEVVLIDVREPQEFAAERIDGALLYPLSTFDPFSLPACGEGRRLIFHCGSGKRSQAALDRALQAGLDVRSHMAGGMAAWKADGHPTLCSAPSDGDLRRE